MSQQEQQAFPPQQQQLPGQEHLMHPTPEFRLEEYQGSGKLKDKVALITGGDSGIGRAVATLFAREGAQIAISFLPVEQKDAEITKQQVQQEGSTCLLLPGDLTQPKTSDDIIKAVVEHFGRIDVLVNNASRQEVVTSLEEMTDEQIELTFKTNILSMFYLTKRALSFMHPGSAIINTTSVTAYQGRPALVDYSSTKGAIVTFTRSLALNLAKRSIRVNAVAPGPIWTPLIPSSFSPEHIKSFGTETPLGRAGQPEECAPAYVFLASNSTASYITGQVLHVNGGSIVNG